MKKKILTVLLFLGVVFSSSSQKERTIYKLIEDLSYSNVYQGGKDDYMEDRCKLDIYYPVNQKDFATVVWFHGGGLTGGEKSIPNNLKNKGNAVVAVNYRLHPQVECPVYIEDAAASVAWVFRNIEKYGGDTSKIFVAGHSAGGYLASIILQKHIKTFLKSKQD